MRRFGYILAVLLVGIIVQPLRGAHIVGGEVTYDCLGGGNYQFTLKIYRDCAGGGAEFDGGPNAPFFATVTIYEGNSSIPFQNFELGAPIVTNIDPELSNPCLIVPPGICVEEGVYSFIVNLPFSPSSYHISYQRCCRNNTITNIVNPGEAGATYTMELTSEAQAFCNDSPTFNNFPPIVICNNEPIDFDFSASDPDGDELVYKLCAPFSGGGTNQMQPELPNGVAPNPDLPPPYPQVVFQNPYSALNPLLGNPPLSIDLNTGFITGVPEILGQFVVGVCVEERRNGQLLSVLRRDFQFNVADCQPTVVADILEDSIINGQEFLVVSCGENTVTFVNESFQQQFIDQFSWNFDINGSPLVIDTWDATVTFPDIGNYEGQLILNPGTACGDTANILVNIFPEIEADFEFAYDTCIAGPVTFTDLSESGAGPNTITDWGWSFGDGNSSDATNPIHTYLIPGALPVDLTVTDINGCQDTESQVIQYFPVPNLLVVSPSAFIGCEPADIFFDNLSVPIDSTYEIIWDFGDGEIGMGVSPTHTYQEAGVYTVTLEITSPIGCFTDTVFEELITVLPSPTAGFSFAPQAPSNFHPTVTFTDESLEAQSWRWDFSGLGLSFDPNPVYTFPDTGIQVVTQVVTHTSGCTDTAVVRIDVAPEVRYFLPNAFTPNGDGLNDGFRGEGVMEGAVDFEFQIWDRYGELIFETNDPFESWNGQKNNIGEDAPSGVYVVVVRYIAPRGGRVQLNGFATLIR